MAQKRKDWNGLISGFKASDLVFLDESGCNTDMTRRYAYSLGGSRAVDSTPLSKPKNTTILSSIQLDGNYAIRLSQVERLWRGLSGIWKLICCLI